MTIRELLPRDPILILPKRPADSHKGTFGHLGIFGGSQGLSGSVCLAARGALRSGAGLVTAAVPACIEPSVSARLLESMTFPIPVNEEGTVTASSAGPLRPLCKRLSASVVGCGLGRGESATSFLHKLLPMLRIPTVLDADALYALSVDPDLWNSVPPVTVLTPHFGEMARLIGSTVAEISGNTETIAQDFSAKHNVTLVLKSHRTIIALPDGQLFRNTTGCPALAKGGSGDLLAGMLGAFLANGYSAEKSACMAVYYHGLAAEYCTRTMSEHSVLASDCCEALPYVL